MAPMGTRASKGDQRMATGRAGAGGPPYQKPMPRVSLALSLTHFELDPPTRAVMYDVHTRWACDTKAIRKRRKKRL